MSPEMIQNLMQVLSQQQVQAPRPLALHLAIQSMTLTSSLSGLTNLNAVSQSWKGTADADADRILTEIGRLDPQDFATAVQSEILDRVQSFASGVNKFKTAPRKDNHSSLPCVYEQGSTRLRHAKGEGAPVLLIPSLINRAYVLDLAPGNSVARSLAAKGFDVYLVDWGAPGDQEKSFRIDDYIDRLECITDFIVERAGTPPMTVGYCMGGLLALALATREPDRTAKLALLATPWDFSKMPQAGVQHLRSSMPWLETVIELNGELPVDILQGMFAGIDPCATIRKFRQFAALDENSPTAQAFVQLEDWLNDGVPLAGPVARECLQEWYIENSPAEGRWKTDGRPVDPVSLNMPAAVFVPENDIIVPPETALPLGHLLPKAEMTFLPLGHIGMIVGGRAKRQLIDPLSAWLMNPA